MGNLVSSEPLFSIQDWLCAVQADKITEKIGPFTEKHKSYEVNKYLKIYPQNGYINFGSYFAHGDLMIEHTVKFDIAAGCPIDWYQVEWTGSKFKLMDYASKTHHLLEPTGFAKNNLYVNVFGHPTFSY